MKNLVSRFALALLVLLMCSHINTAQAGDDDKKPLPATLERHENKQVFFEKIYPVDGAAKDELYKRAKQWVTTNLKTGDHNVAFDDQEKNYINTTAGIILSGMNGATVDFKISLMFKDGKVRMECPSFTYVNISTGGLFEHELGTITFGGANRKIYRSFDAAFEEVLKSFEAAITTPVKSAW